MKPDEPRSTPPDPGVLAPSGGKSGWLQEMFVGADETAPYRPGRYLETPQRLGILPTWSFWNRKDVWRRARWFVAPVAGLSVMASMMLTMFAHSFALAPIAAAVPVLQMGLLERYIRSAVRRRAGQKGIEPHE
jgi:hypothetical protein